MMWVILRAPGGMTEYWSLEPILTTGSAFGAFAPEKRYAFGFAREKDAKFFLKHFLGQVPGCRVSEAQCE